MGTCLGKCMIDLNSALNWAVFGAHWKEISEKLSKLCSKIDDKKSENENLFRSILAHFCPYFLQNPMYMVFVGLI